MALRIKRVYDPPSPDDGTRILVDRLWPRGLSKSRFRRDKQQAGVDRWLKGIAPSDALRKWFGHRPERWPEFRQRYRQELRQPDRQPLVKELAEAASKGAVTLLFGAKDPARNQAIVLREVVEDSFRIETREGLSDFSTLVYIARRLRDPETGCPWDRAQSHDSIKKNLLEETYEALHAIDQADYRKLCEELGDLLLQVALHAQFASEASRFTIEDVVVGINQKLVRRHPHVFGDATAASPIEVERNWEAIKQEEQGTRSVLEGVPAAMPALAYSQTVQHRAARVGFEWKDIEGVWDKVKEEIEELHQARTRDEQEHELGDIFTAVVNIARWLDLDAESALRKANRRFYDRFTTMERLSRERGLEFRKLALEELDALWEEAKRMTKA